MSDRITGRTVAAAAALSLLLLGGCTSPTTVLTSANPSRVPASDWADYDSLPVALRGVIPGRTKAELAAIFPAYHAPRYASLGDLPATDGRRMALYVNPANNLDENGLCNGGSGFVRGPQVGESAYVVGALCDGPRVITRASAYILTKDQNASELAGNFETIRGQLYQSLYPGANDPDRYYEGY